MAEIESKAKITLEAEDKTGKTFEEVGKKMSTLQSAGNSLASGMTKLGLAGIAIAAAYKAFDFFKVAGESAMEDAQATRLLIAQIENLGVSYSTVSNKVGEYIDKMFKLGMADTDITNGLTQLTRVTKNLDDAMKLSTLASDLAASGMNTYSENIDMLQRILLGKGIRALTEYGIQIKENATVGEQLAAVQQLVTRTTEQMATETDGKLKIMKNSWDEFKENLGSFSLWLVNSFASNFNSVMTAVAGDAKNGVKEVSFFLGELVNLKGGIANILFRAVKEGVSPSEIWKKDREEFDKTWESIRGETSGSAQAKKDSKAFIDSLNTSLKDLGGTADKTADKMADAFKDFSKNVVNAFEDQSKAIKDLRQNISDLDSDLADSVSKSDEKYQQDVKNLARKAKDKMDQIDKEIADERASMNQGWRTRVDDLEEQKRKEQAVIDKAGGVVSNLNSELQKDDFDQLRESHQKELDEIKAQSDKKKKKMEAEIAAREDYLRKINAQVMSPNFYSTVTKEGTSFLGQIGAAPSQQSIVFNFNGPTMGDEGITKLMMDTINKLNRDATLRQSGGK